MPIFLKRINPTLGAVVFRVMFGIPLFFMSTLCNRVVAFLCRIRMAFSIESAPRVQLLETYFPLLFNLLVALLAHSNGKARRNLSSLAKLFPF